MATRIIALVFALTVCGAAQAAAPVIQHWTTDNGARVYFVPAPELPIVDIQVTFNGGGARDGNKPGVAQLTSALLDDGAGELDADAIALKLEMVGAQLGNSSHRDMAVLSLRSLTDAELLDPALAVFKQVLAKPSFPEDAFERERKRMLIAAQARKQSPGDIADELFMQAVYGDHPYAHDPSGTEESLAALNREDVIVHHRRYYVARNAVVALVGALDRAGAERLVAGLLADLPEGEAAPALPVPAALAEARTVAQDYPSTQTHVLMGQPGLSRDDPDYFPLYVGNHVLGGGGLVSRLNDEIREKRGLSYSVYSYFNPMARPGPYTLGLQTKNESAAEALGVLRETLAAFIKDGPTAAELQASQQNITGGFPLRIAGNGKILSYIAMIGFYGLPLDYLETFPQQVEAVTAEQVRDAFQRRVQPDKMVTVTVGGTS